MSRLISISHSPNLRVADSNKALAYLLFPWKWGSWYRGEHIQKFEAEFAKYHSVSKAVTFDSGRSALSAILDVIGIKKGDEIILQPLTCIVLPNAILWQGATPIYVDIDTSFNIDPDKLGEAITDKTRAIIVQHTFGQPAQLDKIRAIADEAGLILIEDCAHSLGAEYHNKKVGTIGDIAFFSFGRDKVISSVSGGAVISINNDLITAIQEKQNKAINLKVSRLFQYLFHFVAFSIILPLYNIGIGKLLLVSLQGIGFLNKVYTKNEKKGEKPQIIIKKFPNALADIIRGQFALLDETNKHRVTIASMYDSHLKGIKKQEQNEFAVAVFLRYTIIKKDAIAILKKAKNQGILLGDWYTHLIMPDANVSVTKYKQGQCPRAEELVSKMINLPTYSKITKEDAESIVLLTY